MKITSQQTLFLILSLFRIAKPYLNGFNRMFEAAESTYYFYEQVDHVVDDRLRMNVTQLLLESARSSDEGQRSEPEVAGSEDVWGIPTGRRT